jgi:DivIVA domain-containing protein
VILFLVLIVLLLTGLTTAAVMGKISGFMADPTSSQSFGGVPSEPLSTVDLSELHFDQGLRGYRMDQVDEVIDALGARVRELESEVASLSGNGALTPTSTNGPTGGDAPDVTSEPREG